MMSPDAVDFQLSYEKTNFESIHDIKDLAKSSSFLVKGNTKNTVSPTKMLRQNTNIDSVHAPEMSNMPEFSMCSHDTLEEDEEDQFDQMMNKDMDIFELNAQLQKRRSTKKIEDHDSDESFEIKNQHVANPKSPENAELYKPIFSQGQNASGILNKDKAENSLKSDDYF